MYRAFSRLGGVTGWLRMDWAWPVGGLINRLVAEVGLRRRRRDMQDLRWRTRWTSSGWKRSSRTACCASVPR